MRSVLQTDDKRQRDCMEKDTQKTEASTSTEATINGFFTHLSKRTEKIVTALYLVTDCLDPHEVLRAKLRTASLELLTLAVSVPQKKTLDRGFLIEDAMHRIVEIATFVRLASAVGLVSEMNAGLLIGELKKLEADLNTQLQPIFFGVAKNADTEHFRLDARFFSAPEESQTPAPEINKGHENTIPKVVSFKPAPVSNQLQKETESAKKTSRTSFDIAIKNNRRTTILKLIKDKKIVSIKDICSVISDCSEKTVQRELGGLVDEGVLKKMGERRWSQYALV